MQLSSLKSSVVITIILVFTCFHCIQLSAQTIERNYLGRWFHYTVGSEAKPDSNYTRLDTFIEMTFLKNGTYNLIGYIKSDIFTPGKGHLKFKKNFRYMDGRYEISDNNLQLMTGFKTSEFGLSTVFAFESAPNKFKQPDPYAKLWDTRSFYEYTSVENFKNTDIFFSRKRKLQILYIASPASLTRDSIPFWTTSPDCAHENHWPKPALLGTNVPLKKSMLDSVSSLVEDFEKIYRYDGSNHLIRYYYTSKKDKSFYYDITYSDSVTVNTMIKTITDSKDGSHYVFTRNEKECLARIDRYDAENKLVEEFYSR